MTRSIRTGLQAAADPEKADGMARYMRNIQAFAGVNAPQVQRIADQAARAFAGQSVGDLRTVVLELFSGPWREERYAAIRVAERWKAWQWRSALPLIEWMIERGQWWDIVDAVATRLIGPMLLRHPDLRQRVFGYIESPDPWFRRTALLCQLKFKHLTDSEALSALILKAAPDPDFFIRKGIGWALQEYAKTNPKWVLRFVRQHHAKLLPLSRREALKNLV